MLVNHNNLLDKLKIISFKIKNFVKCSLYLGVLLSPTYTLISYGKINTTSEDLSNINYKFDKDGLALIFNNENTKLNIGADVECGFVRDGALYASFGLEAQIYKCSKMVLNFNGLVKSDEQNSWLFKVDFAPVYDSLKIQNKPRVLYQNDTAGRPIDGNNHYVDWYKNLGSRLYYLGEHPLIEAYVGYNHNEHTIKTGRMKSIIGFDERELFWGDDAKFAPMSYWLSRDLFSGLSYNYKHNYINFSGGVFSGGNPTKGYSNYLDRIESPNIKSNNTATFAGRLELHYDDLLNEKNKGSYIYASYLRNITGSTWVDELKDGKRNGIVGAYGIMFNNKIYDNYIFSAIKLFGQYTHYLSGLRTASSQAVNDTSGRFKDINQRGYFIGGETLLFDNKLSLGAAYENFSRFDYNVYSHNKFRSSKALENIKQKSYILSSKYFITPFMSVGISYHKIKNPYQYLSDILNLRGHQRLRMSMYLKL